MTISIIVCSTKPTISNSFEQNIKDTIGTVDYEMVLVDNSLRKYSIFEAYNKGVEIAKGEYLCFVHEDVLFHSWNWGQKLLDEFEKHKDVGMMGVVGGHVLNKVSTCWWYTPERRGIIRQGYIRNGKYESRLINFTWKNDNDKYVVSIDGVWMAIRKQLFAEISFDQTNYSGFHFYDMDISMQIIAAGYKIMIIDIEIEHLSEGNVNASFYKNCIVFHKKWDYLLPVFSYLPTKEVFNRYNVSTLKKFSYHVYFKLSSVFFNETRGLVSYFQKLYSIINGAISLKRRL